MVKEVRMDSLYKQRRSHMYSEAEDVRDEY